MAQWLGPGVAGDAQQAENAKIVRGKDPATARPHHADVQPDRRPRAQSSVLNSTPPASAAGHEAVAEPDRSGPPSFDAFKIVYYEDLPEMSSTLHPGDAKHVEKPLQIPDEAVGTLSDPKDNPGRRHDAAGRGREARAGLYRAVIDQDIAALKSISPLCRNWGDEFLRKIIFKPDKDDRIVEILEIRRISKTGRSASPIAAVPVVVKLKNGRKVQEQMIVQFRQFGDTASCVGPRSLRPAPRNRLTPSWKASIERIHPPAGSASSPESVGPEFYDIESPDPCRSSIRPPVSSPGGLFHALPMGLARNISRA